MAFNSNESTEGASAPKKLYVGVEKFRVTAINPDKAQLAELGITVEEEPNYISEQDGVKTSRVAIYLDNDDADNSVKTVLSIFLRDEHKHSMAGVPVYINNKGQVQYVSAADAKNKNFADWITDVDSFVPMKTGQDTLVEFLRTFANVKGGEDAYLENIDGLFNGDFSELQALHAENPNNKIGILFGVKTKDDGTFVQTHYTKKFERAYSTDYTYLKSNLDKWKAAGGGANVYFGDFPFNFREFVPSPVEAGGEANDDMPF